MLFIDSTNARISPAGPAPDYTSSISLDQRKSYERVRTIITGMGSPAGVDIAEVVDVEDMRDSECAYRPLAFVRYTWSRAPESWRLPRARPERRASG
jgi:hypothetical protein